MAGLGSRARAGRAPPSPPTRTAPPDSDHSSASGDTVHVARACSFSCCIRYFTGIVPAPPANPAYRCKPPGRCIKFSATPCCFDPVWLPPFLSVKDQPITTAIIPLDYIIPCFLNEWAFLRACSHFFLAEIAGSVAVSQKSREPLLAAQALGSSGHFCEPVITFSSRKLLGQLLSVRNRENHSYFTCSSLPVRYLAWWDIDLLLLTQKIHEFPIPDWRLTPRPRSLSCSMRIRRPFPRPRTRTLPRRSGPTMFNSALHLAALIRDYA